MNDFNLEELKEIKRCLKYMIEGQLTPYSNLTIDINSKLKFMIDNYCEHDNSCADFYCDDCKKELCWVWLKDE